MHLFLLPVLKQAEEVVLLDWWKKAGHETSALKLWD
jgi:hypothetical protein